MANRFLNNITINDEYTLPAADGTADQIITTDGAGQLSFVDQSTVASGTSRTVSILVKNISSADGGVNLSKGDPVYVYGSVGASERLYVDLADAGDSSKMPCVALLDQDLSPNGEGTATVTGKLKNLITSPIDGATPTENDTIYVKSGGGLTLTKPTGSSNLIQNVGQVGRVSTSSDGNIVVSAILRSNDVPNLTTGKIWVGSAANTIESSTVHLDETNGRMGINTNSPDTNLEIEQSGTPGIKFNNTAGGFPTFGSITAYNNTTYRGGLTWASTPVQNGAKITYVGFPSGLTTTGQFEVGANFVDTSINNGSMVTRLNVTGLGIGTTSPNRLLTVQTTSTGSYIAMNASTGNTTIGSDVNGGFIVYDDTNSSYRMVIKRSTGNVGIGTTNPGYKLDVDGEVRVGDNQKLKLWDDPFGAIITPLDAHLALTTTRTQDNIYFDPGNSTKMVIEGGGNVGIGTTSPSAKLHIQTGSSGQTSPNSTASDLVVENSGNSGISILSPSSTSGNIFFGDESDNYVGGFRYYHNVNEMSINVNNAEALRIDSSRNVGIGTTSPARKLEVYNGSSSMISQFRSGSGTSSFICFANTGSTADQVRIGSISSNLVLSTSYTERMRIDSTGNVGIGTTSPSYKLHIAQGEIGISNLSPGFTNPMGVIGAYNQDANNGGLLFKTIQASTVSERMRILANGNVGIGTTSPSPIGTNITTLDIQGSSGGGFRFGRTDGIEGGLWTISSGTTLGSISSIPLYFRTGNQNRAAILANGNFGIGTTSPTTKLHVLGTTSSMPSLGAAASAAQIGGSSYGTLFSTLTSGRGVIQQGRSDGISTSYDLLLQPVGGRVGIAKTSASYTLDVTGEGRFTGDLRCLSLIQTSQRDQKKDIADIDKTKARAIPFKEYKYKSSIDGSERKRYGVVAEDIENDYPELVHTGADGVKGINYIDLLVKRVAELEKELEDISLTPGPKGDTGSTGAQGPQGATGPQGPAGANGTNGNDHLKNVQSISFNEKSGQLEITIGKTTLRFNPAK